MYGKDDGLYSEEQICQLQSLLPAGRLVYLADCSHTVFMDQQTSFIDHLGRWLH
jgi:proline iminopeptidase